VLSVDGLLDDGAEKDFVVSSERERVGGENVKAEFFHGVVDVEEAAATASDAFCLDSRIFHCSCFDSYSYFSASQPYPYLCSYSCSYSSSCSYFFLSRFSSSNSLSDQQ
jgi:hypothetical protein